MTCPTPSKPLSALAYHRTLSPTAAIRVSPICLGAMSLGDAWADRLGGVSKQDAHEIYDYFFEQGGNFIDTANNYQDEQSETWLGEWMKESGKRDELVIATKYTVPFRASSNYGGNSAKSLRHSLEASLQKLQTSFVDILFVHCWDYTASVAEVMNALHHLVVQGKILYLGISDTPAWIVSKANEYARAHSLTPFVIYQGQWSAATRDFERDILPMCRAEGMAVHPWGVLGGGNLKTKQQREVKTTRSGLRPSTEGELEVSAVLEKIAAEKGTVLSAVALSYVMHKQPFVFPLVGCRTISHLAGNIKALDVVLTRTDIDEIDNAYPFDIGFPLNQFIAEFSDVSHNATGKDIWAVKNRYPYDDVGLLQAIPLGMHVNGIEGTRSK